MIWAIRWPGPNVIGPKYNLSMMKTMSVLEAKAQLKEVMDYVRDTGESVLLTKNGEPYVVMQPIPEASERVANSPAAK
jgi:prevent-host-death family protein